MRNPGTACTALVALAFAVLGCKQFTTGSNVNLFQGDNAVKAAAAIKAKVGVDDVKVIRAEVRKDSMKITIQVSNNPKNLDEYTFEKGRASGPKPVQAVSIGNLEMTADKYHMTDMDDINFAAIPETVRQAVARSELENGAVDLISMEHNYADVTNPSLKEERKRKTDELRKQLQDKQKECIRSATARCIEEMRQLTKQNSEMSLNRGERQWDLAWRIFVEGPRGRKNFYADKQGNLIENPY